MKKEKIVYDCEGCRFITPETAPFFVFMIKLIAGGIMAFWGLIFWLGCLVPFLCARSLALEFRQLVPRCISGAAELPAIALMSGCAECEEER